MDEIYVCPHCGRASTVKQVEEDPYYYLECGCEFFATDPHTDEVWYPRIINVKEKISLEEFIRKHNELVKKYEELKLKIEKLECKEISYE